MATEIGFFEKLADKIDDPCYLIALAVVVLAGFAIRSARIGAREEGERAVVMLREAMGNK